MSEYTRKPRSTRHNKKHMPRVLLVVCLMLVVMVGSIAGTVAWLTATTEPVTNTFTVGDINITLKETKKPDGTEVAGGVTDWSAQMIPGKTYTKNPVVTVVGNANNVDCWLFVKVDEPSNKYIEYDLTLEDATNEWTQGNGTDIPSNVWYRPVSASTEDQSWSLIEGDTVKISEDLTKANISQSPETMTFTAYAVQKSNGTGDFTAAQAWAKLNPSTTETE